MIIKVRVNQPAVLRAIARRNLSQNGLAVKAGISSGFISQIMRGSRYPSPAVREKLQNALRVTFDDIFIIDEVECDSAKGREAPRAN